MARVAGRVAAFARRYVDAAFGPPAATPRGRTTHADGIVCVVIIVRPADSPPCRLPAAAGGGSDEDDEDWHEEGGAPSGSDDDNESQSTSGSDGSGGGDGGDGSGSGSGGGGNDGNTVPAPDAGATTSI